MIQNFFALILVLAIFFIVGFFFWTLMIVLRQKHTWKTFAAAKGLRYTPARRLMECSTVMGTLGGFPFSLFGSEYIRPNERVGSKKRQSMEVSIPIAGPTIGILATGEMIAFAASPDFNVGLEVKLECPTWTWPFIARAQDPDALIAYLTPERVHALTRLMETQGGWVTFVMQEKEMLIRLDTPDPLDNPQHLEIFARAMISAARALS